MLPLLLCLLASLPLCLPAQRSGAARDAWQRPEEVMDALGIKAGSRVADVGAGSGYFTFHLAARVGPAGKVFAVDIDYSDLEGIRRRAEKESLAQIETILGAADDPRLPAESVEVVLVVDAYHEMRDYDRMLDGIFRALIPGGRLAVIDGAIEPFAETAQDKPGESRERYFGRHRIPAELVREDAARAGFRLLREEPGFERPRPEKRFYFLVFEKPQ